MRIVSAEISRDVYNNFDLTVQFRGSESNRFDREQIRQASLAYTMGGDFGIMRKEAITEYRYKKFGISSAPITPYTVTLNENLKITKVIFNNPATIVFWSDGTKTVVKCGEGETFDEEKGFAIACTKKMFGNNHIYYGKMQKAIEKAVRKEPNNDNSKK